MKSSSIITKYTDISVFSGYPTQCRHHLIFGRGLRELAEEDGLWIPLTNAEHNMSRDGLIHQIHENSAAEKLSKIAGQLAWEKRAIIEYGYSEDEVREAFRNRYGVSYL